MVAVAAAVTTLRVLVLWQRWGGWSGQPHVRIAGVWPYTRMASVASYGT